MQISTIVQEKTGQSTARASQGKPDKDGEFGGTLASLLEQLGESSGGNCTAVKNSAQSTAQPEGETENTKDGGKMLSPELASLLLASNCTGSVLTVILPQSVKTEQTAAVTAGDRLSLLNVGQTLQGGAQTVPVSATDAANTGQTAAAMQTPQIQPLPVGAVAQQTIQSSGIVIPQNSQLPGDTENGTVQAQNTFCADAAQTPATTTGNTLPASAEDTAVMAQSQQANNSSQAEFSSNIHYAYTGAGAVAAESADGIQFPSADLTSTSSGKTQEIRMDSGTQFSTIQRNSVETVRQTAAFEPAAMQSPVVPTVAAQTAAAAGQVEQTAQTSNRLPAGVSPKQELGNVSKRDTAGAGETQQPAVQQEPSFRQVIKAAAEANQTDGNAAKDDGKAAPKQELRLNDSAAAGVTQATVLVHRPGKIGQI